MLNPVHLRTLQEIVRSDSFADAANRLGYTASAVSQQMAALEQSLGTVLFERTARSTRPNAAARRLAQRSASVLHALDALQAETGSPAVASGRRVNLGIFPSAALYVLPQVLRSPRWARTGAAATVLVGESSDLIRALTVVHSIDIAVIYQFDHSTMNWPASAVVRQSWSDPLVVLLPTAWAASYPEEVALADLVDLPWITHTEATSGALAIDRVWAAAGLAPGVAARSDDYAVTRELVRAEMGAAIVPAMTTPHLPADLVTVRPSDLHAVRQIVVLTREDTDSRLADALSAEVTAALAPTRPAPGLD